MPAASPDQSGIILGVRKNSNSCEEVLTIGPFKQISDNRQAATIGTSVTVTCC